MLSEQKFGVICLGIFVGFLLGFGLFRSKNPTLKGVITVVGAALGGGPILFMKGIGPEKWMYPVGLLVGLLGVRMLYARLVLADNNRLANRKKATETVFALFDLRAIVIITIGALVYSALT